MATHPHACDSTVDDAPAAPSAALFDMSGKTVLVTGASRGLGCAMVRAFANAGADVVLASRSLPACEEIACEIRKLGRKALAVSCDLSRWTEVERLVEAAYGEFDRIHVLVNSIGMSPKMPSSAHITESLLGQVIDVNFKGPFRLTALVGARMAAQGGGSIINVSSRSALRPNAANPAYAAAKAALNAASVAIALELAERNVRVNLITPGPFATDMAAEWIASHGAQNLSSMRRVGQPREIVTAALYFASDHSSYTTGANLVIDGGKS
jgi:NAD(P)-dependent dehydrogenase (short-subunit alcohol dehydrogenase family)